MFLLFSYSSRPSYVTLQSGLTPDKAGESAKALESAGISYSLGDGGTAIKVKDADAAQARVSLAEKNLLSDGSHPGWDIIDNEGLGATDFRQKIDRQRALEGVISENVERIEGISSANVQLVLPQETLFADSTSAATSSVLPGTTGMLDPPAVAGIAHLVSAAVEGRDTQHVTITDQTGTLLWPTSSTTAGSTSNVKLQA